MKTTHRLEHKYRITYADYFRLKPLIAALMIHDVHGDKEDYPVHSIYLDDVYHSGAADKAFGNQFHKKYRIRFYHDPHRRKLELKEKVGENSTKYATAISEPLFEAIMNQDLDVLNEHFDDPLIRRFTLDMLLHNLKPTCNIVYRREAYRDPLDNLRITFDHSLAVGSVTSDITSDNITLLPHSHLLIEVKYEHFIPKPIRQVLKQVTMTKLSVSKYFLGYQQIQP